MIKNLEILKNINSYYYFMVLGIELSHLLLARQALWTGATPSSPKISASFSQGT